jgi:peptidoglycan/xylan/chitin deacetylase (PgdA/CDA1 family)
MTDVLVLCYHAVSERWPAALAIAPQHLEEHVSMLADRGYRGVTFHEAVMGRQTPKALAITFDDAYRSVIELALPILSQAGFPATVFAPTDFVGTEEPMAWPGIDQWRDSEHREELVPMSWEELDSLARAGWEIGSHTRSHPRLPTLGSAALDAELQGSRQEIERHLGRPCHSLSYPYGDHDQHVVEAARRAGYAAAAGTLPGRYRPPTGPLDWPRFVVVRGDGNRRLGVKISPLLRRLKASPAWTVVAAARRRRARRTKRPTGQSAAPS